MRATGSMEHRFPPTAVLGSLGRCRPDSDRATVCFAALPRRHWIALYISSNSGDSCASAASTNSLPPSADAPWVPDRQAPSSSTSPAAAALHLASAASPTHLIAYSDELYPSEIQAFINGLLRSRRPDRCLKFDRPILEESSKRGSRVPSTRPSTLSG